MCTGRPAGDLVLAVTYAACDPVNEGFGNDFYRKGNSVKRSGRFSEPPDSENWKIAVLIPFPKISS